MATEARLWDGDNVEELKSWVHSGVMYAPMPGHPGARELVGDVLIRRQGAPARLWVAANGAWSDLTVGDWIVRDARGHHIARTHGVVD